jgi:hypothetical protein
LVLVKEIDAKMIAQLLIVEQQNDIVDILFRWAMRNYHDIRSATTLKTHLKQILSNPSIGKLKFLANIHPKLHEIVRYLNRITLQAHITVNPLLNVSQGMT